MATTTTNAESPLPSQPSAAFLPEVMGVFLRLGFTAFGGPAAHIAMMREELVQRRKWVSEERFIDLIGIANLIPGPTSTEVAIYLGYLRAGWLGLLLGGACFIVPAMLIVLALAWAYVTYGALPQMNAFFYGIQPVVVAIVAYAIYSLGRVIYKSIWAVIAGVGIVVLYLLGVNVLVLLLGSGVLIALSLLAVHKVHNRQKIAGFLFPASFGIAQGAVAAVAAPMSLVTLFLTFLKYGAVVYGSGYVLLAFLRADLVQNLGWLTDRQLLDAVAVGQFTPGPLFTTATFIGYLLAGLPGALLATLGIFLPSFAFIALIHPMASRLRQSPVTAALLDGINIAAIGLMAAVLVQLGQNALVDPVTWGIAAISLFILFRFKVNSVWLIIAGAGIGLLRYTLLSIH